jgi:phosphoribosylformimino-5-aminoimidazole carboxamide ribotide isomerase
VLVALEARAGRLAAEHWSKHTQHTLLEVAQQLEREGVAAVVHAEHDGDGLAASAALARGLQVPVFDASGVRDARQVKALGAAQDDGLAGALLAPECLAPGFDLAKLLRAAG